MAWQILTAIGAFLFTGRALLFLLGILLGGMLTVANGDVMGMMQTLVGWWQALMNALFE